jgi:hypothetical protein
MSFLKLNLDLFGEIVSIDQPTNLFYLKQKISESYALKKSDVDELVLSYNKEAKSIYIENEDDYKTFLDSKITEIHIDITPINFEDRENLEVLNEEKTKDEKKFNELLKQNEDYKKLLSTKFISQKQKIIEINKQIQELFNKRKNLIQYIKSEKAKIIKMKKNNDRTIADLGKKIGIKNMKQNNTENLINSYKNKKFNKIKIKRNESQQKRRNSRAYTSPESKNQGEKKSNKKINLKRRASPMLRYEIGIEKKVLNFYDNKNITNPFNEEQEESKIQKSKYIKIAEILNNKSIKLVKNISNFKNTDKKNASIQEKKDKKINSKMKKNVMGKYRTERRNILKKKNEEKNNENTNKLIKRYQKYGRLLSSSKDKINRTSIKADEKKVEKKGKRNSKIKNNNINSKKGEKEDKK